MSLARGERGVVSSLMVMLDVVRVDTLCVCMRLCVY